MLRGTIEYCDGARISGWIHSTAAPLRDAIVLAFLDNVCIGSGKVDILRQDLLEAGLDDGFCGFAFDVSATEPAISGRIIVKLANSDFALPQRGSRIVGADETTATDPDHRDFATIAWMRERGWLDQTGFDFLQRITTVGLYDRTLADPPTSAAEAKRLFELYRGGPVVLQETLIELRNLTDERRALIDGARLPLIAVHAPAGAIRFLEGSRGAGYVDGAPTSYHPCRSDRLLLLDTRAMFVGEGAETAHVYRAI